MSVLLRFGKALSTEEWQHYIMVDFGRLICEKHMGLDQIVEGLPNLKWFMKKIIISIRPTSKESENNSGDSPV